MNLLILMSHYPVPPRTGSTIMAYNTIKELAGRHTIDLICFGERPKSDDLEGLVRRIEVVTPSGWEKRMQRPIQILWMLIGTPGWIASRSSWVMKRRVAKILSDNDYDAIVTFDIAAIQYLPKSHYGRCIANIEDPPSIKFKQTRQLSVLSWLQRAKIHIYTHTARWYESRSFPALGRILVLSKEDKRAMEEEGGHQNLGYVPYGVTLPCDEELGGYETRSEGMIVVSGNMYHPPNVAGVLFFLREVFPLVLNGYPSSRLWVIGNSPDQRIYAAAEPFGEKVVITGAVSDISEYLRRAKVSVCPVQLKIGVQTKVLEALACGTPVVTLSSGNSGVQGISGSELWVEDEPRAYAARVVELLKGVGWTRLSANGRRLVKQRFSWKASALATEREIAVMIGLAK